jgi:hypothetical protein
VSTAAFILSVAAVLVSLVSVLVARRALKLEQDRRRDELRPSMALEKTSKLGRVILRNNGPDDLSRVKVWLVPPDNNGRPVVLALAYNDAESGSSVELPPMPMGVGHEIELRLAKPVTGGRVVLRCDCYGRNERWTVPVTFEVAQPPRVIV